MKTLRSGTRNVIGTSTTTTTHATTSFLPSPAERGDIPLRSFCFVQKFETSSPSLSLSGAVGGTQRRDRTKTRLRRNPRPFGSGEEDVKAREPTTGASSGAKPLPAATEKKRG